MKKRNFVHLVQNMVVLSSMSLMPMKHAIGRVMSQITGADKPMSGPADAAEPLDISKLTLDDLRKQPLYSPRSLFFWTKEQTSVLANTGTKAILCGDFGTGKSLLLHSLVLSSSQEETGSFIISGLKDEEK